MALSGVSFSLAYIFSFKFYYRRYAWLPLHAHEYKLDGQTQATCSIVTTDNEKYNTRPDTGDGALAAEYHLNSGF